MKVPDIGEEERAEIHRALVERKEALEKLEKDTDKKGIPIDRIDERLQLYRDRDRLENGERQVVPGLLAIFAAQPELSTEALENQRRNPNGQADLFGGGVETGGGNKPGRVEKGAFRTKNDRGGEPEHIGDIITPPAPRAPLQLVDKGSPSNNTDVLDPTGPKVPTDEEAERIRAAARGASPTSEQIPDSRTSTSTSMGTGTGDI